MNPLENTALVFILAIALGIVLPQFAVADKTVITLLLVVAMSLSLMHVRLSGRGLRKNAAFSVRSFLLNYGLLSGCIIAAAYFLVPQSGYFAGFVIMAAVPPAVAVVPFAYLLKGDTPSSLQGEVLCYMLALAAAPAITLFFLGFTIDVLEMIWILLSMLLVPLAISLLLGRRLAGRVEPFRKPVVNLAFGAITYIVIGMNQHSIVSDPVSLAPMLVVLAMASIGTGALVYFGSRRLGSGRERAVSYSLFAGLKNGGMSAAFAVILVSPAASLPAALHSLFTVGLFLFLKYVSGRW